MNPEPSDLSPQWACWLPAVCLALCILFMWRDIVTVFRLAFCAIERPGEQQEMCSPDACCESFDSDRADGESARTLPPFTSWKPVGPIVNRMAGVVLDLEKN